MAQQARSTLSPPARLSSIDWFTALGVTWPVVFAGLLVSTSDDSALRRAGRLVQNFGLAAALGLAAIWFVFGTSRDQKRSTITLLGPVLAVAGYFVIAAPFSPSVSKSVSGGLALAAIAVATFACRRRFDIARHAAFISAAVLLTSWLLRIAGSSLVLQTWSGRFTGSHEKVAPFGHLGGLVALLGFLRVGGSRRVDGALILIGVSSLAASLSRSPSIGLVAGLLVIAAIHFGWSKTKMALAAAAIVLVAAIAILTTDPDDYNGPDRLLNAGLNGRDVLWEYGWEGFLDSPVVGHGYGSYGQLADRDLEAGVIDFTQRGGHNVVINVLFEHGLVGLALYGAVAVATWWRGRGRFWSPPGTPAALFAFSVPMATFGGSLTEATSISTVVVVMTIALVAWDERESAPG